MGTNSLPSRVVADLQRTRSKMMQLEENSVGIPPGIFLEALDELTEAVRATYRVQAAPLESSASPPTDSQHQNPETEAPELLALMETGMEDTPVQET